MDLIDAASLAAGMHAGQLDKAGLPYIGHPLRVMLRLPADASELEKKAALLHDVLEDCGPGARDTLVSFGADRELLMMLDELSKRPGERYDDYPQRVANGPARRVKLADIADNSDPRRLALLPPDLAAKLKAKYDMALEFFKEQA
jgi:(p)ppGpp synthase/HD superfamily hydrolase